MKYRLRIIAICLIFAGCQSNESVENSNSDKHLKYFGFTLIDTNWDDPHDGQVKTNYIDEVAPFSNIADILILTPSDNIIGRLQLMNDNKVKAILHVYQIFFEIVGDGGSSGMIYDLRSNYKQRWNTFIETNNLVTNKALIEVIYLGEEPTWNGISFTALKTAADYIKSTIDEMPIMLIEAYPAVNELQVPNSIDWVGFDHYFTKDPINNVTFLSELAIVKSKLVYEDQKLVLVLDAHYIQEIHGEFAGITQDEMAQVATSYYNLAQSEADVIALIGYTWPGGFDTPTMLGARQLPQVVRDEYARIGREITGK